jgi:hypothetical protein
VLGALSEEHERLDTALDHLAAVNLGGDAVEHGAGEAAGTYLGGGVADGPRAALHAAAVAVRSTVHDHLAHEEPLLFPALGDHISPAEWQDFAQRVIATTLPVGGAGGDVRPAVAQDMGAGPQPGTADLERHR